MCGEEQRDTVSFVHVSLLKISPDTCHAQQQVAAGGDGPAAPAATSSRDLSLKQILDVIEEIYVSKVKFDAKCDASRLPRETMAKHLYTYLNQKYGLKSLILGLCWCCC